MDKIPEEQLNELRDAFALFDKDGKGSIKASEVGDLARAMGTNCTVADANKLSGATESPNKELKFEEFVPIMLDLQKIKDEMTKNDFIEGFKCVMDNGNTGLVEEDMIKSVLVKLGEKLPAEYVDELLAGMTDGDGNIKYMDVINKVLDGNY